MGPSLFYTICYTILSLFSYASIASDTLTRTQNLTDGQTLVSPNNRFELSFFSPGNSKNRYLGIRYHDLPLTVVWVANRNHPITDTSGQLTLTEKGSLVVRNVSNSMVWSTNETVTGHSLVLQLLDSGNLVVREIDGNRHVWESFDDVSDTLLPGRKLGWNMKTGLNRVMKSWKTNEDPSEGEFSFSMDTPESPQLILRKNSEKQYRWGPWDGAKFSGGKKFQANPVFTPIFTSNSDEVYYTNQVLNDSVLSRYVITQQGSLQYFTWTNEAWDMMSTINSHNCDRYSLCGAYGNCYDEDISCRCLKGFTPKSPQDWGLLAWSGGCRRKHELNCSDQDGFVKYSGLKLPDRSVVWGNFSLEECRAGCLKTCNCMGYTYINVSGNGLKCVVWLDKLVDIRNLPDNGEELYIRMARGELESIADAKRKKKMVVVIVVVLCTVFGMIISATIGYYICQLRKAKIKAEQENNFFKDSNDKSQQNDFELPLFDLGTIFTATDKFSSGNKIGQGGFGPVYKGELPNGREIAVKRLSQSSGQGLHEFKNEVILIAKLQHRNLVRLLGCCIEGEERMLIYEYLPNKSLDNFIFGLSNLDTST